MYIKIEIKDCSQCPFSSIHKVYTADSFENVSQWDCNHSGYRKVISQYVERKNPEIPDWCPAKINL